MRQYIARSFPDQKGILKITGKDSRYFCQVLRAKTGDMVIVRLPDGALRYMTVCRCFENGEELDLQICNEKPVGDKTITRGTSAVEVEPVVTNVEYWLFQIVAKPQRMDMIVRQAAECGVKKIVPVIGDYTQAGNATAAANRGDRNTRIIREARQQSGSSIETQCLEPVDVYGAIALWEQQPVPVSERAGIVLYERTDGTQPLRHIVQSISNIRSVALVVGCEGGISPVDMQLLRNGGFIPVHFDTNILRCETAALYGLAVLQSVVMEKVLCHCNE